MAGRQQSDKQFTLHARLLWALRAHVEAYFKKHLEISTITNVKTTEISVCVYIVTKGYMIILYSHISCCFTISKLMVSPSTYYSNSLFLLFLI